MRYTRSGGRTAAGPEDWFTGTVYVEGIRNPDHSPRWVALTCDSAQEPVPPGTRTRRARRCT